MALKSKLDLLPPADGALGCAAPGCGILPVQSSHLSCVRRSKIKFLCVRLSNKEVLSVNNLSPATIYTLPLSHLQPNRLKLRGFSEDPKRVCWNSIDIKQPPPLYSSLVVLL